MHAKTFRASVMSWLLNQFFSSVHSLSSYFHFNFIPLPTSFGYTLIRRQSQSYSYGSFHLANILRMSTALRWCMCVCVSVLTRWILKKWKTATSRTGQMCMETLVIAQSSITLIHNERQNERQRNWECSEPFPWISFVILILSHPFFLLAFVYISPHPFE